MEKSKVDMFLVLNSGYFRPMDLPMIKSRLEALDDDKFYLVQSMQFQKPDTIFIIALLLGWERFFLNDVVMGVLKLFLYLLFCYLFHWIGLPDRSPCACIMQ